MSRAAASEEQSSWPSLESSRTKWRLSNGAYESNTDFEIKAFARPVRGRAKTIQRGLNEKDQNNYEEIKTNPFLHSTLSRRSSGIVVSSARRPEPPRASKETKHPYPLGRRHRLLEHQRLQPGHDGLQDAEH